VLVVILDLNERMGIEARYLEDQSCTVVSIVWCREPARCRASEHAEVEITMRNYSIPDAYSGAMTEPLP